MEKDTLVFFGLALTLAIFGWIDYRESKKTTVAPKMIKAEYDDGDSYIKIHVRNGDYYGWKTCWVMAVVMAMCGLYNEMHESNKTDADILWKKVVAQGQEKSRKSFEQFKKDGFGSKEQKASWDELFNEQKPAVATTGIRDDPEKN